MAKNIEEKLNEIKEMENYDGYAVGKKITSVTFNKGKLKIIINRNFGFVKNEVTDEETGEKKQEKVFKEYFQMIVKDQKENILGNYCFRNSFTANKALALL